MSTPLGGAWPPYWRTATIDRALRRRVKREGRNPPVCDEDAPGDGPRLRRGTHQLGGGVLRTHDEVAAGESLALGDDRAHLAFVAPDEVAHLAPEDVDSLEHGAQSEKRVPEGAFEGGGIEG